MIDVEDIRNAVLAGNNIRYSNLNQYEVARHSETSRPLFYPGGFCVGVKLVKNGAEPKCLRCWHTEINGETDLLGRMREISDSINQRPSLNRYLVNYEVVDELLQVGDKVIPGIVMDWVEGEPLNLYLKNLGHSPGDLKKLAENFKNMCNCFAVQGAAHGDLSGPNIMIRDNEPVLVDYDSMYFKEDGQKPKTIDGTPSFQHPGRSAHPYMELCCDNFSQHVIYVTLLILSEISDARGEVDPKEKLYFDREDMLSADDFKSSNNTKRAYALGNLSINKELDIIETSLRGKYLEVPPLEAPISSPRQRRPSQPTNPPSPSTTKRLTQPANPHSTRPTVEPRTSTSAPSSSIHVDVPWYKKWYVWLCAALTIIVIYTIIPINSKSSVVSGTQQEQALSPAIKNLEGNYTLRERLGSTLVNGIRTSAIKKISESDGKILVTSEYGPEFYDFTFTSDGKVQSEQLGVGEISYNKKLDKITIMFKQGERICEFTK